MFEFLYNLFFFIVAIMLLVGIHEYGHFWVARKFGVRVERFSIGMGKPFWTYVSKKDGCEYALAPYPIGGYVKMFGEQEGKEIKEEDKQFSYSHKSVYKRMAIVLAGPAANFLLAIVVLWVFFIVEKPGREPHISAVKQGSFASQAQFKPGDKITAVDGIRIKSWSEVQGPLVEALLDQAALDISVVDSAGNTQIRRLDLSKYNTQFKPADYFRILGLGRDSTTQIREVTKGSPADSGQMKAGDIVVKVGDKPVKYWRDMREEIGNNVEKKTAFVVKRGATEKTLYITPIKKELTAIQIGIQFDSLGDEAKPGRIDKVLPNTPAEKAKLMANDNIIVINGIKIKSQRDLRKEIKSSADKEVNLVVERGNKVINIKVTPKKVKHVYGEIGVSQWITVSYGAGESVSKTMTEMLRLPRLMVKIFYKMATLEASTENISGPFTIGEFAGRSASVGWVFFLQFIALVSISLGVINLFPIPVLDGGHFMFYVIEAIQGKPVSDRIRQVGVYVGVLFILSLMSLAFYNDFVRIFS